MSQLASVTGDGHVILDYQYLYDRNGNITEKSGGAYQNRYRYDSMNRLREAAYDQGEPEWYSYDRAGNRIKSGKGEYEEQDFYNKKNQLIQLERKLETLHYTYDLQGNLLEEGDGEPAKRYRYNVLNQQTQVGIKAFLQKNHYDGEGMRFECEEDGMVLHFVYDHQELVSEKAGEKERNYLRGHDIIASDNSEEIQYYLKDEIRSVVFLLDEGQNIVKSYRYDAFGEVRKEGGGEENRIICWWES